jgi:hypothetical protein
VDGAATPVVWIAPARSADDRRALDAWASARGMHLADPVDAGAPAIAVDRAVADKVEAELDRARDAIAAQETEGAERALARAAALLHGHPELPQAAWLMAEVHRQWSARWNRLEPRDRARADAAWQRAAALDGGRVAGVGETLAPVPPSVRARLALDDAPAGARALLDGVPVTAGDLTLPAGEHQLTVTDGGLVRYASWVGVAEGTLLRVAIPPPPACSTGDLGRAREAEPGELRAPGVRCESWVAALPAAAPARPGTLRVAVCSGAACGPLVEWRLGGLALVPTPTEGGGASAPQGWPTWATVTIFGAGVVASMAIALVATGAFEKTQGTESRFVNGGVKTSSHF